MVSLMGENGGALDHLEHSASPGLGTLMLVALHLVLSVVFLNALIAIMGDTFDRMQDSREESMQLNRCQLVVELLSSSLNEDDLDRMQAAYRWVHVLQPRSATGAVGDNEWEGRIKVIRQLMQGVDAKQDQLEQRVNAVQVSVDAVQVSVEQRVDAVQASMEQRMASIQTSMDSMARALEGLSTEREGTS